ncbi:hypothetical protein BJ742DRAFT_885592 [Cladochytrium replicatum]|nr:hypothetical protein BJ742DRAFT_885592 [Cladochytrium replicatum]
MPNKQVEVVAIYVEDREIPHAKTGNNVRIRLKNVEEEDVMPGFVLCGLSNPVHIRRRNRQWRAQNHHLRGLEPRAPRAPHCGGSFYRRYPPKFLKQGDKSVVQLDTSQAVCLEPFKVFEQLGRFTLTNEGKTVAIGKVLKLKETTTQ